MVGETLGVLQWCKSAFLANFSVVHRCSVNNLWICFFYVSQVKAAPFLFMRRVLLTVSIKEIE